MVTGSFWTNIPKEIADTIGYPVIDPEINSKRFTSKIKSFPTYDFIEILKEYVVIGSGA